MTSYFIMWERLGKQAKVGLSVGCVAILCLAVGLGFWSYRADYQVLFSDVSPRDAASMTAELDRMKIPYQLSDGGNTILVPKDIVYKTRLKLMGKDLPLHGAVGFEVFNNADFGMTEFVQKVNYQRAIQGELTRTILSIDDIQAARVHLAIPEQGLFKKSTTKPKASVTVNMKQGHTLSGEQIVGIQRLVAASVPDIIAEDVTILDQHGVALTRVASSEVGGDSAGIQLDSKKSTEEYLQRKLAQVLDQTFGPGEAIASVDVLLNADQSKVTTEEVLPAKSSSTENGQTGVVVRERQTTRENGGGAAQTGISAVGKNSQTNGSTTIESDYQVGRRVEQLVTPAGSVKRLTIAVIIKRTLSETQMEKIKEVVGLAVGFNSQRGDAVIVYSLNNMPVLTSENMAASSVAANVSDESRSTGQRNEFVDGNIWNSDKKPTIVQLLLMILAAITILVVASLIYVSFAAKKEKSVRNLSEAEKEQLLKNIQEWIQGSSATGDVMGGGK